MNKPTTIKAREWATIAADMIAKRVGVYDAYGRGVVKATPGDNFLFCVVSWDNGELETVHYHPDQTFTLMWRDDTPSLAALLATKPSALDSVLKSVMAYEQPHYEIVDQAQSELATLREKVAALEAERNRLSEALERAHGYAAFLYVCAKSGEQPETYEWYLEKSKQS